MVILKEQVAHLIGQELLWAEGNAKNIPFDELKGNVLVDIKTFGKEILFCFPRFTIRIHLMLFGKYAIDSDLNYKIRLGLEFENARVNFYACECKFITDQLGRVYNWSIDVMNPSFDRKKAFEKLLSKPKQLICEALLDQNILAGVGNKIKNEVLFRRQVHPESVMCEIPESVLETLVDECVQFSLKYLDAKREGVDHELWQVYKKTECLRDYIPIKKDKIGKSRRSCYFCDKCQRLYIPDDK